VPQLQSTLACVSCGRMPARNDLAGQPGNDEIELDSRCRTRPRDSLRQRNRRRSMDPEELHLSSVAPFMQYMSYIACSDNGDRRVAASLALRAR
jgi:hypothetical protein